jgi:hypothetical protein
MNYCAEVELRSIGDEIATRSDYRRAGEMFTVLASEVNSIVDFREEMLTPDPVMAPRVEICHVPPRLHQEASGYRR